MIPEPRDQILGAQNHWVKNDRYLPPYLKIDARPDPRDRFQRQPCPHVPLAARSSYRSTRSSAARSTNRPAGRAFCPRRESVSRSPGRRCDRSAVPAEQLICLQFCTVVRLHHHRPMSGPAAPSGYACTPDFRRAPLGCDHVGAGGSLHAT